MDLKNLQDKIITIYFSKDRPMQLDLALSTNQKTSIDWDNQDEVVLYSYSNDRYKKAYEKVKNQHSSVRFMEEFDFKKDLLALLKNKEYVFFAVDDTVFTTEYSLKAIIDSLVGFKNAVGFSLRLGENTKYCYPTNKANSMPVLHKYENGMMSFDWTTIKNGDFGYPLELSSSVYRVEDIIAILKKTNYENPNDLEWSLYSNLGKVKHLPLLLSYDTSVAFSNPINKVQTVNNNRSGSNAFYTPEALLVEFEKGGIISPDKFYGFIPNGCHQEISIDIIYL